MEIASTTTPFAVNFWYAASMSGASATHAAHQLAPKVSHTGCPFSELRDTSLPSTVVPVKSCAGLPIFGAAPPPGPDSSTAVVPDAAAVGHHCRRAVGTRWWSGAKDRQSRAGLHRDNRGRQGSIPELTEGTPGVADLWGQLVRGVRGRGAGHRGGVPEVHSEGCRRAGDLHLRGLRGSA